MTELPLTSKGSETRQRILIEARNLLVTLGPKGLVMREVAKRCTITLGNLQYYFANSDALLAAVIYTEAEKDQRTMVRLLANRKSQRSVLRGIVDELIQRWRRESAVIFSLLNLMALHDENFKALYARIYAKHYEVLEQAIALAAPGNTPKEYARRARLVSALIDGAPYQTQVGSTKAFLADVAQHALRIAKGAE